MKKMNIATIIFTYNRPRHTEKVLTALSHNDLLPEKLIIFQDGMKDDTDVTKWNAVNQLIKNITWCDTETRISAINKGLAKSIVKGINDILYNYDAVIVLEDDCVTQPQFMRYMINALNKYRDCKQVYHINGYTWEADVKPNGYDAYFCGRAGSWGWATWKDRWSEYKEDYKILARIKKNPFTKQQFEIWGMDLESYLYGNVKGECDSWATFWALTVIEKNGYCLIPYKSLVNNIGFDGSGVHCGVNSTIKTELYDYQDKELLLPGEIKFPKGYDTVFTQVFDWISPEKKLQCYYNLLILWMQLKNYSKSILSFLSNKGVKDIAVWGTGRLCDLLLEELKSKICVRCLIESNPINGSYCNIPVKRIEDLDENVQLIVVIPVYDIKKIRVKIDKAAKKCDVIALDELIIRTGKESLDERGM